MEQLPELEVDRFATLQMEQDSEREALLRQMQALKENKEQIEEWLTGIKDTPEYQEVEEAVREANEDLRTSENAYENMGEYVPQMRQVEQKGMKPSDVGISADSWFGVGKCRRKCSQGIEKFGQSRNDAL